MRSGRPALSFALARRVNDGAPVLSIVRPFHLILYSVYHKQKVKCELMLSIYHAFVFRLSWPSSSARSFFSFRVLDYLSHSLTISCFLSFPLSLACAFSLSSSLSHSLSHYLMLSLFLSLSSQ